MMVKYNKNFSIFQYMHIITQENETSCTKQDKSRLKSIKSK